MNTKQATIQAKKVVILGSGALKIGEAGEFDYSGSQAIKALKEEGIKTILINPNIATIQTSKNLADEVYFLPVTPYFVEKVLAKEKPDGLLLSFGGQTALNCGLELSKRGILKKLQVTVLGTPVSAIQLTEDRQAFANHLGKIHIATPRSEAATTLIQAKKIAKAIGYPVMVRAGFTLGGQGSGVAKNEGQLAKIVTQALAFAPQVLIEQYLHHFKEIEYEVVRDQYDNCITVCNMENMDPLGIHTGDSIVVAPSQTLTNDEYHLLRKASITIVRSLGIIGECNVQFALNPRKWEYYVIEVNARLSRSSALASKATGYPLAYIAAKLGLGYNLTNLKNKVTGVTQACFEPALDYIVVKIPRWDLQKFDGADQKLGSSMKSVGEVMGIGRTFEEAYQKAIRMIDLDYEGATSEKLFTDKKNVLENLSAPTPKRRFAVAWALQEGITLKKIYRLSGIDPWFLSRIKHIVDAEKILKKTKKVTPEHLRSVKQLGFSDKRIGELVGMSGLQIRALRKKHGILPCILQIDTLAAEFPAQTNYLYMTYNASHNDIAPTGKNGVIVLGSGPYRIGSSVEFDWCSVETIQALKKYHKKSLVINCNPETVSTDYDMSDRLYFEELTFERITDIYEFEQPLGVIVSVGGQTPNNRAKALHTYGVNILGTNPQNIDRAEDRSKFSTLLDHLGIQQPAWNAFTTLQEAKSFAKREGYPVLIRPSYVLSGSAMHVCGNPNDLEHYLQEATKVSKEYPVVVSKFFENAQEVELDGVAQEGAIVATVISEHIEQAGVHSGDATIVLPAKQVEESLQLHMVSAAKKLAKELHITGPFNIQFLVKNKEIFIIEINIRASRTFPFISKVTGVNMMELFVETLFKNEIKAISIPTPKSVCVKVAQFSFARLTGANPNVGVEMASTGEVACFGSTIEEAFLKGILATGGKIPMKGIFISLGGNEKKEQFLPAAKLLIDLKLPIFATEKTAKFLNRHGVPAHRVYKIHEKKSPNILHLFQNKQVDLVIIITDRNIKKEVNDDYAIRRTAVDNNLTLFTELTKTMLFVKALVTKGLDSLETKPWSKYRL